MATMKAADVVAYFGNARAENWGYVFGASGQEWTEAKQKNLVNKMVNKYGSGWQNNGEAKDDDYYRSALYGAKWIGHRVADCSGMFVGALATRGIRISHSSHYQYTDYCKERGTLKNGKRSNGEEILPGTAVFVYKEDKKRYTHVGCYMGAGIVIEAAGSEQGVITSKVTASKWTHWGMLKAVDYSGEDIPIPEDPEHQGPEKPADKMPTVRNGDKGNAVKLLQEALMSIGYSLPKYGADGKYGAETEKAVKAFQKAHGLTADGVCGPKTWDALEKAWNAPDEPKTYTITISGLTGEQADELISKYGGSKRED